MACVQCCMSHKFRKACLPAEADLDDVNREPRAQSLSLSSRTYQTARLHTLGQDNLFNMATGATVAGPVALQYLRAKMAELQRLSSKIADVHAKPRALDNERCKHT